MEVSISTGLYYTKSHNEILDIIVASGCKNIELFLNQAFIDLSIDEIQEAIVSRGLNVKSIHLPLTFIAYSRDETEEYWIKKGLDYLDVLGGDVLVSHFFYLPSDKNMNNDVSHFSNIQYYNKSSTKYVCTENLPNIDLDTKLKNKTALLKELRDRNVMMTFDTTHAATHGDGLIEHYCDYKDYIRNIHLSDYSEGNEHKVLGSGTLPIIQLLETLVKDGYKYPITLEFDFENSSRNVVMDDNHAIELLKESIDYVQEHIE